MTFVDYLTVLSRLLRPINTAARRCAAKMAMLAAVCLIASNAVAQPQWVTFTGSYPVTFAATAVGSTSAATTLSFSVYAAANITAINYLTFGATNLDFQAESNDSSGTLCAAKVYSTTTTCTLDVTFTPTANGLREGAVQFMNGTTTLATVYISGNGTGQTSASSTPSTISLGGGSFTDPVGVVIDGNGTIYVGDEGLSNISTLTASCLTSSCVTTYNTGTNRPFGMALDGAGNLYVAYPLSGYIYEITPACLASGVTTCYIKITDTNDPQAMVVDGSGNVYIAENLTGQVVEFPRGCTSTSCETTKITGFSNLSGIAIDASGNLYVVSGGGNSLSMIPSGCTSSTCVTTLGGSSSFHTPYGVAVDNYGEIYVSNYGNATIVKLANTCTTSSCVSTVATGVAHPTYMAFDANNNFYYNYGLEYLAESYTPPTHYAFPNTNVLNSSASQTLVFGLSSTQTVGSVNIVSEGKANSDFIALNGDTSTTLCKTGSTNTTCTVDVVFNPQAPGLRKGAVQLLDNSTPTPNVLATVYLSGVGTNGLGTFDPGTVTTVIGTNPGNGTPDSSGTLTAPTDVAVDAAGDIFAVTGVAQPYIKYANSSIGYIGENNNQFQAANGIALDGLGNAIITIDQNPGLILVYSPSDSYAAALSTYGYGTVEGPFAPGTQAFTAKFYYPSNVATDGAGNIYFTESNPTVGGLIEEINVANGTIQTIAGGGTGKSTPGSITPTAQYFKDLGGLDFDASGNLYFADTDYYNNVWKLNSSFTSMQVVAGNGNNGYSGDSGPATSASLNGPSGVAVDPAGNLYIADQQNSAIREVLASNGNIITLSGLHSGVNGGYSAEGLPATASTYNYPTIVRLDGQGNLYIADTINNVIREINRNSPSYNFATTAVGSLSSDSPFIYALNNDGNAALTITAGGGTFNLPNPYFNGVTASYYLTNLSSGSACPTFTNTQSTNGSLAVGSSCNYDIDFKPTASTNAATMEAFDNTNPAGMGQVITLTGTGTSSAPAVTSISPSSGPTAGGTSVTITGAGFTGTTGVTIGGSAATSVTVVSDTSITATTPAGTAGTASVVVTTSGGSNAANTLYTYTPPASYTAPTTTVGSTSASQTAYVTISTAGTLGTISVLTQGVSGLDYAFVSGGSCATGTAYTVGQFCTVKYSFAPGAPGVRMGAVVLTSSTPAVLGTSYITGTGTGPLAGFTPGTITTVAGNNNINYSGNNVPATSAGIGTPTGVTVDSAGNLYIADDRNAVVRKVTAATGIITTVAGNDTDAYSGDNGQATSAAMYLPSSVAVDGAGNLYIADFDNYVIRKVTAATGIITTVAGNNNINYSGNNVPATSAGIGTPSGVAIDGAGNLYIADPRNSVIREVTAATGLITTVAGNDTDGYSGDNGAATSAAMYAPTGVAVDGAGNLYIADFNNHVIRKVTASTGIITTVAGNNNINYSGNNVPATSAGIGTPTDVAVDGAGNLYIADDRNAVVRKVTAATGLITTVAGNDTDGYSGDNGPATSAAMYLPYSVAVDGAGNLYIADFDNYVIRKVTAAAATLTYTSTVDASSSAAQSVTVTNNGTSVLTASSPGLAVSSNYTQVAGSGTPADCTSTFSLASGTSCNISLEFAPVTPASGTTAGTTVLTDNNLNVSASTQTINLTGTAVPLPPTVSSINPSSGPAAGGTSVTITGTNFTGATAVTIGGTAATGFTVVNSTTITAVTPAGTAGTASVVVTTSGGSNAANTLYTYVAAPTVTAISPTSGPLAAGTSVTITGTNLTGATGVTIGGAAATSVVVVNSTTITAVAPAGTAGTASVIVTTPGGSNAANTLYTYVAAPTVTGVSPSTGAAVGGTSVTITGTNLASATAVKFGTTSVTTFTSDTATSIVLNAPAGTAGNKVDITVTTIGGTSATSSADKYTFAAPTATQSIASTTLTQNHAGAAFTPVTGSGGIGTLSYSVLPALPTGLSMSASTGAITGTPTGTSTMTTYTVTVTDASNDKATNTFTLTVNSAVVATQAIPSQGLIINQPVTAFTPVTGSGGTGTLSYSVSPTLPAGIAMSSSTGAITGLPTITTSATVYTVTVTDANNATATNTFTLTVSTNTQTITSFAPASPVTFGVSPITLTATGGGSGNPVTFSVLSGPGSVSGTNGATLTVTGAGTIMLAANQAGNTNYSAATPVTASIVVYQKSQTITAFAPATPVTYGVSPITLTATGGASGNAVTFSVLSGPGSVSGTNGATLTVTGAGTIMLAANQAGNTNYTAATQVTASIVVNQATQSITSFAPASPVTFGVSPITLTATGGASGNAVTFSVLSGPGSVSGTNGATLTVTGAGTIMLAANQAGNTNYTAATQITASIVVNQATQSITSFAPASPVTYGVTPIALTATGGASGNAVTFSVLSGPGSVSGTNGATLTVTGTGTIVIAANQAGNTSYQAATQVTANVVVYKAPLTVTANAITISYGQALPSYTANITGFVNGDSISVVSGSATLSTSPATPVNAGFYPITPALGTLTATNYTFSTFTPANLTINKATSAFSISGITQTSPLPSGSVGVGVSVTYAVTVTDGTANSTGTPTGSVQFYNGTTALGSPATLIGGVATLTLPTGFSSAQVASITAVYSGDGNFAGTTSPVFTETVSTPGFTVIASPSTLTVTRGTTGSATLTFTPFGNYQGTATYTCTGLPAFASCIFTPSTVTFSGNNAVQTATMQLYTLAPQATPGASRSAMLWIPAFMLGLLLMVRRRNMAMATRRMLLLLVMVCAAFSFTGCGTGSYFTPTGTDSIVVNVTATATPGSSSSNLNQTATITITIQ